MSAPENQAGANGKCIGLIGVGLMGAALAERALGAGFRVVGYDLDPGRLQVLEELGGQGAGSSSEAARACDWLVFSLMTTADVARSLEECGDGLRGKVIVDTSTGDPDEIAALASRWGRLGVGYLDATVAGNSEEARRGEVLALVGGDEGRFAECRPFLRSFAREVYRLGEAGSGARMKLVFNLVLGLHRAVLAEGLSFAGRIGIEPETALEILRSGAAASHVMVNKGEKMLRREFAPQARLAQHLKDVRILLRFGREHGALLPLSERHEAMLAGLVEAGDGALDNSAVIKAFTPDV